MNESVIEAFVADLAGDHNGRKFMEILPKIEELTKLGELNDTEIKRLIKNAQFSEDISSEIFGKISIKIKTQFDLGLALTSIGRITIIMIHIIIRRLSPIKEQLKRQEEYHSNLLSNLRNARRIKMDDKQYQRLNASYIEIEQQSRSELKILKKNFEKQKNELKYQWFLQFLQEKVQLLQELIKNNNDMDLLTDRYLKEKIKLPTTEVLSNLPGFFLSLIQKLND